KRLFYKMRLTQCHSIAGGTVYYSLSEKKSCFTHSNFKRADKKVSFGVA
ncbi:MAG: hypothetical protein ACI8PB_001852, partial [Desulforhopalus sp.]